MKIYEKPSVDVRTFDVEDVMTESGYYDGANENFKAINGEALSGVVFQW